VNSYEVPRPCVAKSRALDADTDRRLVLLHQSVVQPVEHRPRRRMPIGVAVPITGGGLFVWGWTHSSSAPDGRALLALAVIGLVVLLSVLGIGNYRRLDRADAARTAEIEKRLQQNTSGAHHLDGV
jgi:hypothetical protein